MDVERFPEELARLFEDFPRSMHPQGRRFDDVVREIPNLAEENNLALINLAASLLGPGESYVEVGTYLGASLISAMRGNEGKDFVAIDNFAFGALDVKGRSLPAASRAELERNLERFGARGATIFEGDAFDVLRDGALEGRRVGVYYYDGPHSYREQLEGLLLIEPYLADAALLVVDDTDWEQVRRAVRDYIARQQRARVLLEIEGDARGQPQWWEGVIALALHQNER